MLQVIVYRDDNGYFTGAELSGHAGDAPKGLNLACAAVSALLKTLLLGLQQELGFDVAAKSGDSGYLAFRVAASDDVEKLSRAGLLFRTFVLGVEWVASQQEAENSIIITYAG